MNKLILIRHGQSIYNLENKFTGWKDVDLTDKGRNEALYAVELLKNINIQIAYTSNLIRAQETLNIILNGLKLDILINKDERLNERDYGDLIGQNKKEAALKFGDDQVQIWRRSYNVPPPGGESLEMTYNRCIPYFKEHILNNLKNNNIIISAHGNSIRAIVKYILNLSSDLILKTEIGWCEPWIFTFDLNEIISLDILYNKRFKSNSHLPVEFKTTTVQM